MNQRFGHCKEHFMPFTDHQLPVSINVSFKLFKEIIIYQRWPTSPSFIKNVCFSYIKFMTPLCHFLPVHNITINTNNFTIYFSWSFSFGIQKSNKRTHFTLGRICPDLSILNSQNTPTRYWEQVQKMQGSEWEYVRHNSVATFTAVIPLPSHPFCILNFWITILYFYGLVSHTSWE